MFAAHGKRARHHEELPGNMVRFLERPRCPLLFAQRAKQPLNGQVAGTGRHRAHMDLHVVNNGAKGQAV